MKAMGKLSRQRKPLSIDGMWAWGYVTQDNLLIAPVVLNTVLFPVGIPIYTNEEAAKRRVEQEAVISRNLPLPDGQTVHHYEIGRELDPVTYARAGIHQFRNALNMHAMGEIKDVAENEYRNALVFIDPPILKVDDEMLLNFQNADKLRLISCVEEWDIEEICAWNQNA